MTLLALGSGSWLAVPMAVALAATGFWWNVTRPGRDLRPVAACGPCRGCPRGCVGCRERIDA